MSEWIMDIGNTIAVVILLAVLYSIILGIHYRRNPLALLGFMGSKALGVVGTGVAATKDHVVDPIINKPAPNLLPLALLFGMVAIALALYFGLDAIASHTRR